MVLAEETEETELFLASEVVLITSVFISWTEFSAVTSCALAVF